MSVALLTEIMEREDDDFYRRPKKLRRRLLHLLILLCFPFLYPLLLLCSHSPLLPTPLAFRQCPQKNDRCIRVSECSRVQLPERLSVCVLSKFGESVCVCTLCVRALDLTLQHVWVLQQYVGAWLPLSRRLRFQRVYVFVCSCEFVCFAVTQQPSDPPHRYTERGMLGIPGAWRRWPDHTSSDCHCFFPCCIVQIFGRKSQF